jgi:glutathione transport system substrate-binding protein
VLDVSQIEADDNLEIITAPSLRQWHFYINVNQPHLSDVRVRQALNHAVDQEALVRVAFQGYAIPRYSIVPEKHLGAIEVDPIYAYDTAKALELLEAAGWTQDASGTLRNSAGEPLHIKLAHTTAGVYNGDQDIASAVAGFWRAVGIEVEEQPMDRGTFYGVLVDENSPQNNEVIAVPFQIDFQDGAAFLDLSFTERSLPPACCNFSFYNNAESWAKIEEALAEADPETRAALIEEAQRLMWADVPVVPGPQLQLVASKVKNLNVTLYPNDLHPVAFASFASP